MTLHRCQILCAVALLAFVTGCATDEAARYYGSEKFAEKKPDQVELLKAPPTQPYDIIADFQARGLSVNGMRAKAAKVGADAVIIQTLGGLYNVGDEWAGHDSQAQTYSRITGTAIRYKNP